MLEGGGKTPILNPIELEELGFKIVSYPLSLIGVSIRAMQVGNFKISIFIPSVHWSHSGCTQSMTLDFSFFLSFSCFI